MIGFAEGCGKCASRYMGVSWVSFLATVGGVGGERNIQIDVKSREIGNVTVAVRSVGFGAGAGDFRASGRLGILPCDDV